MKLGDIQLTVAEIKGRRTALLSENVGSICAACRGLRGRPVVNTCIFHANAPTDIDKLLDIIDSLTGQNVDQGEKLEDDQGK